MEAIQTVPGVTSQDLLDALPDAVVLVSDQSRIVLVNRGAEKLFGYLRGELVGQPLELLRAGAPHSEWVAEYFSGPRPLRLVMATTPTGRRKDGSEFPAELRVAPVGPPGQRFSLMTIREVTTPVDRAGDPYRALVEAVEDHAIFTLDDRGRVATWNPSAERIMGYTERQVVGQPIAVFYEPEACAAGEPEAALETAARTGRFEGDGWRVRKDGSRLWTHVVINPVRDVSGKLLGFAKISHDLTEERRVEEALRAAHEQLEAKVTERTAELLDANAALRVSLAQVTDAEAQVTAHQRLLHELLDTISDLVLVKGAGSRIVWANKAFRDAYGMTTAQLQAAVDAASPEPGRTPRSLEDDRQMFETGEPLDLADELIVHPGGSESHVHTVKTAIRDASGKVVMTVGVSRDITEQQRLQAQLMVSDRMASVGTLAAGVAHEINNPLAVVLVSLDFALDELRNASSRLDLPELTEALQDGREAANRVRQIVKDLRIFSRAEEDKREAVDLKQVIDSALRMAWNELRHRATVVKNYAPVPRVDGNDARLGQVFLNLLVNAAQAIPAGNANENHVTVCLRLDERGWVVAEVRDTGSGVAPELVKRLFTPFFTTKPAGVGTGLGLAICQRIVTGLDGEIEVESALGVGTTFRVRLPPARVHQEQARPAPSAPVAAARRGRILVVDDEPAVGNAVRRALSSHDVTVLTGAREALEKISAGERFDVIICDLMMPDLTGVEFFNGLPIAVAERVVFLTGGAFTVEAREFLDQVPNARLEKPFDVEGLRALVNRQLG